MQEFEKSSSLMKSVKSMFEADGVTDDDIDDIVRKIDNFLQSSINANNSISWFQDKSQEESDIERLTNGWLKNEHEMKKRTRKLELFREGSNKKLETLEKSIEESKERNQQFQNSLSETSDRITHLVKQLNDTTKKSEYLRKEIEIIDNTVIDMENYKENTEKEYEKLEEQLNEKQNSLIEFLKKIDNNLDNSLTRHQQVIERHDTFNEALEELAQCYSDFEQQEHVILEKYKIQPIDLNKSPRSNSIANDSETIRFLEIERDNAVKTTQTMVKENLSLASDLEDLVDINTKLTDENENLKGRLCDLQKETEATSSTADEMKKLHSKIEDLSNLNTTLTSSNADLKDNLRTHQNGAPYASGEIEKLQTRVEQLEEENVALRKVGAKTQEIYLENKELIEETANLQEDIERLEQQIKLIESEKQNIALENEGLQSSLLESTVAKQPHILRIKTNMVDAIAAVCRSVEREPPTLEELLQIEHDRNVTLEKSNQNLVTSTDALSTIFRRVGLEHMQAETEYDVNITTSNESGGSQIFASNGISLTCREVEAVTIHRRKDKSLDISKAEENVVDELSGMLQESYRQCDEMKMRNKELQCQVSTLQLEMNHKEKCLTPNSTTISALPGCSTDTPSQKMEMECFVELFNEMGIPQLQYGGTYSIHYQVINSKGTYEVRVISQWAKSPKKQSVGVQF